ncbi:hypothetical protein SAMN05216525_112148 [Bradyrhizobium sp. Gha]|nr:hypothetical protein SAMN05216525_112148 [Bradyrhizobium sp. Gha]
MTTQEGPNGVTSFALATKLVSILRVPVGKDGNRESWPGQ